MLSCRSLGVLLAALRGGQLPRIAPGQMDDFLNPILALDRFVLPDAEKVRGRLNRAAADREKVLIFGEQ
jgi:hypothetical protein